MHIEWIFGECPPVPESVRVKFPYYLAPFVAVFFARTFALAAAGLSFHRAVHILEDRWPKQRKRIRLRWRSGERAARTAGRTSPQSNVPNSRRGPRRRGGRTSPRRQARRCGRRRQRRKERGSMAISRELILEPADIRRISIQCASCRAEAVFTLKKHAEIPPECPSCHKRWNEAFSALVALCD